MCGGVEVGGEPSAPFQCRQVTQSSNEESSQDATEDDWEEGEKGSETELDGGEYSPGAGPNLATPRSGCGRVAQTDGEAITMGELAAGTTLNLGLRARLSGPDRGPGR